ncbi:transcriptional regulator [Mycobacteroides abscessus subsp. bolletii]|nr:transcriptional regulator [Mycobacteroides abscessus subsp. bolletii]
MQISELARRTDVPVKTLRFYETEGLLPAPTRRGNGYRDYSPEFEGRLRFIRQAQTAGLTLAQIREILHCTIRAWRPAPRSPRY